MSSGTCSGRRDRHAEDDREPRRPRGALTDNLPRACAFYTRLFGWRVDTVHAGSGTYLTPALGEAVQGGVVEREAERPLWLPYVAVADIAAATERAQLLGASFTLAPPGGPAGWRSVLGAPAAAQIALWQRRVSRRPLVRQPLVEWLSSTRRAASLAVCTVFRRNSLWRNEPLEHTF